MAANEIALARRRLSETRIRLGEQTAYLAIAKAQAEQAAIAAAGDEKALGSNEAARQRALTIALANDAEYQAVVKAVRDLETDADRQQCDLETYQDRRREWEWTIRLRLAEALDGRAISSDEPDRREHEFDDAATAAVVNAVAPLDEDNLPDDPLDMDDLFEAMEKAPELTTSSLDLIADYRQKILDCATMVDLVNLSMDIQMDEGLTEADRNTLNTPYNARRTELQKTGVRR